MKEGEGWIMISQKHDDFCPPKFKKQNKKKAFSNVNVQSPQEKSFFLIFLRIFI